MAQIFELVNAHLARPDGQIKRFWIEPGYTVKLSKDAFISFYVDRIDEKYCPVAEVNQPRRTGLRTTSVELKEASWLDLVQICGLMALIRCLDIGKDGSVKRLFLEFLIVDKKLKWVV